MTNRYSERSPWDEWRELPRRRKAFVFAILALEGVLIGTLWITPEGSTAQRAVMLVNGIAMLFFSAVMWRRYLARKHTEQNTPEGID